MTDKKQAPKPQVPDKADDREQSERFIDAARTHSNSDANAGEKFSEAFKRMFKAKPGRLSG